VGLTNATGPFSREPTGRFNVAVEPRTALSSSGIPCRSASAACSPARPSWTRCARSSCTIAFFNERVDIEVDGELQERPRTQWSR
jgi:hypothetical protein